MHQSRDSLTANGFTVLKNVIAIETRTSLYHTLINLIAKYNRELDRHVIEELHEHADWTSELLSKTLIEFRAKSPELFGILYDTIQLTIPILQLTCSRVLTDQVAQLMGEAPESLCATGPMLRMDPPNDNRNSLDWHQDSSYYSQNLQGENGVVLWIPMHHVDAGNGAILVCPGSQREGKIAVKSTGKSNDLESEQFRIPQEVIDTYSPFQVKAEGGDAVVFTMDLLHRSGSNSSDKIRFVAGIRYHKMLTDDFLPGKHIYQENTRVGRMSDYLKRQQISQ